MNLNGRNGRKSSESADMLNQALRDRYRCPDEFLHFQLGGSLSSDEGYFRFGPHATCYGRSCFGTRQARTDAPLFDTLKHATRESGRLTLPFDPGEIVNNLCLELYADDRRKGSGFQSLLRKLYYAVRPFTSLSLRKRVQKFHARNWQREVFPRWPVDTTIETLCETLLSLSLEASGVKSVPFVWFWPQGARGCVIMTHDVETDTGRDSCADLMDLDDSFGIKASFQIVPEERYAVSSEFIETFHRRGFEVGIQDLNHDGKLFDSRDEFLRRAQRINHYARLYDARGFRSAVLYRRPEWYDRLDFSFDMSIPNVAHLDPQGGGCCTVMPFFIGDVLELPVTTTQDYTLLHLLNERSIDLWKSQTDLILEKHGLASFIVHPDYIIERATKSVYEHLLHYLRELREKSDIWFALPADVDRWWRARSKMSVVKDGNSWRIDGEGAERAVVAYARNVDGRLVYDLEKAPATV